jgi:hypothetical protein
MFIERTQPFAHLKLRTTVSSLAGAETSEASLDSFYSESYIFFF